MKTKELIRLLQEVDPTGETEVCVDNAAVVGVNGGPAYWDGLLHVIELDENEHYVRARITDQGHKIWIDTETIIGAVRSRPNIEVVYDCDERSEAHWRRLVAEQIERTRKIEHQCEQGTFRDWVRANMARRGIEPPAGWEESANSFFDTQIGAKHPMPADLSQWREPKKPGDVRYIASWHERRLEQYEREFWASVINGVLCIARVQVLHPSQEGQVGQE